MEDAKKVPDIKDPDAVMSCDLMDGRDTFLTLAREKHFEFSSLRRAKYSTIAMLVELHNQGQDRFVYTCNNCDNHVDTRYHCSVCDVSNIYMIALIVSMFTNLCYWLFFRTLIYA